MNESSFLFWSQGNWILVLLGLASLTAFTIFIERLLVLQRNELKTDFLITSIRKSLKNQDLGGALSDCNAAGGAVARVLRAGLLKVSAGRECVETSMEIAALIEINALEQRTKILSVVAHLAPLLGLLGTVLGFIRVFSQIRLSGMVDISTATIGTAMEYALVTTAAGLVVAIPALLGYHYLVARIEKVVLSMQSASAEMLSLISEHPPVTDANHF